MFGAILGVMATIASMLAIVNNDIKDNLIVETMLRGPTIPKSIKCIKKNARNPLQKKIVDSWVEEMNGNKEDTVGMIYSTLFDIMDGNDENTIDVLSYNQRLFDHYIRCGNFAADSPKYLQQHMKEGVEKVNRIMREHPGLDLIENSVALTSQGLEVIPPKVQEYVRSRDIIDAGAFIGDSMIILQNFTNNHIYGYEPNPKLHAKILTGIKNWKFNSTKNVYKNMGLGKDIGFLYHSNSYGATSTTNVGKEENKVNVTTIQHEAEKHNITIGAIKADTEGYSWPILMGGIEQIEKDRPVFLIQVYHCHEEYAYIPRLIRELGNYIIQYRADYDNPRAMYETQIVAYPAEIAIPRYNN